MPLKLQAPRPGKSPNWTIRGTYLGIRVDKSSGTHKRSVAATQLKRLEEAIEQGEYPPKEAGAGSEQRTFIAAANRYMETGHRRKYVAKLIRHFGETPLSEIDQDAIDAAAIAICPNTAAGTRNACVYTPISAILHHAKVDIKIRRPKGAKGRVVTDWLTREDATAIISAADGVNLEFGLLLRFLLYTGLRLGEALALKIESIRIDTADAWIKRLKGGPTGSVRLRAELREALAIHCKDREPHERIFRFRRGGHFRHMLIRSVLAAQGIKCPARRPKGWTEPPHRLDFVNFHTFRHTFATWMRKYGGTDVQGLVATGNWRDARSAARYAHVTPSEEWARVDSLPSVEKKSA